MRLVFLSLLFALALVLAPVPAGADAEGGGSAPDAKADGWDAERYWFASILRPAEAWAKLVEDLRSVSRMERRAAQTERASAYLDAVRASGLEAEGDEALVLFRFQLYAGEYAGAVASLRQVLAAQGLEASVRDQAAQSLAQLLVNRSAREALGEGALQSIVETVEDYVRDRDGADGAATRGTLHRLLAMHAEDPEVAIRHTMLSAMEDPGLAAAAGRSLVRTLQGATHDLGGYEAVRAGASAALTTLRHLAETHRESVRAEVAAADEAARSGLARKLRRAEAGVDLLASMGRPIEMLGEPAPTWTLEHAFGDVEHLEDLKGKVVVLDFWATWCGWCIRSFPAIRDLLRDYGDDGLVVVGVTASARAVYEHRYDLDDDLKQKMDSEAGRPQPAARLASGDPKPEATPPLLDEAGFRAQEKEVLARFIANHEMTWPVVMIDKLEPKAKYALAGWPHAVVIDRQGRVRYFKSGALLRDRPEAVAAFRAVLEDLLAEPATDAGADE